MLDPSPTGPWPDLPLESWQGTRDALHLWSQMVGKTLLTTCPAQNHWWHAALRISARGLASARAEESGSSFELELDLLDHRLVARTSDGRAAALPLGPGTIRDFYRDYVHLLASLGLHVRLWTMPVELPDPVPFEEDDAARPYDPAAAQRFHQILRRCDAALREFAGSFVGKQSPVHFFWGSFDLAATRFSGRRAPERPGADPVTREAYSHEVISFGFWPGGRLFSGASVDEAILYAYQSPEPEGFGDAEVDPTDAHYDPALGEFVLPYASVREAADPGAEIRAFCESVYDLGAELGEWNRDQLDRPSPAATPDEERPAPGP